MGAAPVTGRAIVWQVAGSFLVAGFIGAGGAFVWSAVLHRVRQLPNTVFTTLAYVFILFGLTELWGFSGAIAALTFGVAVANLPNIPERVFGRLFTFRLTAFAPQEKAFFGEAVFLVKTFFFVYLGVSMTFADWRAVATGALLGLIAFPGRALVVRLLASPATTTRRDAALMSVLVPKGLAAAVMASLPAQAGLPAGDVIQGTVYGAIFFSIVACAVLVFVVERGAADRLLRPWLGKFLEQVESARPGTAEPPSPLGLPESLGDLQEPSPRSLS
jgi:NhaP-type Na+/H+ or K+/H+ antiporter